MIYSFFEDILIKVMDFTGLNLKYAYIIIIILLGFPHINTFKKWNKTESSSKYWAKLYLIILFLSLIAIIFD